MKTATIERYHVYGTPRHNLRLTYRGKTVRWRDGIAEVWADAPHYGVESIDAFRAHAKRQGFTHVRIAGDWSKSAKPSGGKL